MSETTETQALTNAMLDIKEKLAIVKAIGKLEYDTASGLSDSIVNDVTTQLDISVEETDDLFDVVTDLEFETRIYLQIPRLIESLQQINTSEENLAGLRNVHNELQAKFNKVLKLQEYLSK